MSYTFNKRKRESFGSTDGLSSQLPTSSQTINPHSHTPNTLYQFALAGLTEDDEDPTLRSLQFPHKALPEDLTQAAFESNVDGGEPDGDFPKRTKRGQREQHVQLDKLIEVTQYFLENGQIRNAAKTFSVVIQLRRDQRPPDLRYRNIWALGAEIIMRQGEQEHQRHAEGTPEENEDCEFRIPNRWGSTENIRTLKAYFEQLNQQYPYDHTAPRRTSAFDFNIAMIGCELYDAYSEYLELSSRATRMQDDDGSDGLSKADDSFDAPHSQEIDNERMRKKQAAQSMTLSKVKEIARYLDGLMKDPPYSQSHDYMRLRATIALFLRDLATPLHGNPSEEELAIQEQEITVAKDLLQRIDNERGELDDNFKSILLGADHTPTISDQLHSTLPIREL